MANLNISKKTLLNVDRQKLEVLRDVIPQGKDAYQSVQWVENNRDKFQGTVYTPIILHIDVKDSSTSKYLGKRCNLTKVFIKKNQISKIKKIPIQYTH